MTARSAQPSPCLAEPDGAVLGHGGAGVGLHGEGRAEEAVRAARVSVHGGVVAPLVPAEARRARGDPVHRDPGPVAGIRAQERVGRREPAAAHLVEDDAELVAVVDADRGIGPGELLVPDRVLLDELQARRAEDRDAHLREREALVLRGGPHPAHRVAGVEAHRLVVAEALAWVVAVRRRALAEVARDGGVVVDVAHHALEVRGAVRQRVDPQLVAVRGVARVAGEEHRGARVLDRRERGLLLDVPGAPAEAAVAVVEVVQRQADDLGPARLVRERADVRHDVEELAGRRHLVEVEERVADGRTCWG